MQAVFKWQMYWEASSWSWSARLSWADTESITSWMTPHKRCIKQRNVISVEPCQIWQINGDLFHPSVCWNLYVAHLPQINQTIEGSLLLHLRPEQVIISMICVVLPGISLGMEAAWWHGSWVCFEATLSKYNCHIVDNYLWLCPLFPCTFPAVSATLWQPARQQSVPHTRMCAHDES